MIDPLVDANNGLMMLVDGQEMSNNNYVIPTAVLHRLLDAATAARYSKCTGCLSSTDMDAQLVSDKLDLQLANVVEMQSLLSQLVRLQASPSSSSSSSSTYSDGPHELLTVDPHHQHLVFVGSGAAGECHQKKTSSRSSTVVVVNPARYKTELCRQFEENGSCRYGDKCQFAHGVGDLRSLARHPKYKTEMCRTFHTTGFCPYGLRCHFIHNDDERRAAFDVLPRGRRGDVPHGMAVSPPLLASLPGDPLHRPIYRSSSSLSPTLSSPEVDSERRGRPILARSSTVPESSSPPYPSVICPVAVSYPFADPVCFAGDLATVRAPCA